MPRFRNILCPIDFEKNSIAALEIACELAEERGATIHLLHVARVTIAGHGRTAAVRRRPQMGASGKSQARAGRPRTAAREGALQGSRNQRHAG